MEATPRIPREQLPITLFDGVVLAVRDEHGKIFLVVRDLCASLSLNPSSQLRSLRADERLQLASFRLRLGNQVVSRDCLLLDDIALWLIKVRPPRDNPAASERLRYVQSYLIASVRSAFATLTGLPDAPSSTIEDLQELDAIEPALAALKELAARQGLLETSQAQAREAWRDLAHQIRDLQGLLPLVEELRSRLQTVEHELRTRITPEQRNTLYRFVQRYGEARANAAHAANVGPVLQQTWREFNARFAIATYSDLPAARFDEAIQFIKNQYRALTGEELSGGTQERLL